MSVEQILIEQKTEDLKKALDTKYKILKEKMEEIRKPLPNWIIFACGFICALLVQVFLSGV